MRRVNLQAAAKYQVPRLLVGVAFTFLQVIIKLVQQCVYEIAVWAGLFIWRVDFYAFVYVVGHRLVKRRLRDVTLLQQLGQHDFSSLGVVFRVNRGIVGGRVLRDAGNHGRFGQGEVRGVFAKIALGRGLYAVTTVSKVHGVHVGFQNLVFAHLLFDAEREHLFLQFPLQAVHERRLVQEVGKHVVLDQLLGQRAGSLAPFEAGEDGTYARPHDTLRVDAVVLVETLVLDGDE